MKELLNLVSEFHTKFGVSQNAYPCTIPESDYLLRHKLMAEENQEYLFACVDNDLVEISDALGDQLYILLGTMLKHGLQNKIEQVFKEIHRSNMSKLDDSGNPIKRADGKILHGPNYTEPNIKPIIENADNN